MFTLPAFYRGHAAHYSEERFIQKLKRFARAAGRELAEKALLLYFTLQKADTPAWAKTIIYSALGYFIFPADLIPDALIPLGFSDDLGAIAAALATVSLYVTPDVRERARGKLSDWFDPEQECSRRVDT